MHLIRHTLGALAAMAIAVAGTAAFAQAWPSQPIRIVVPYAAGGTTDQLARAIQQPMSETLGVPIVIDNKPGAGGAIGTDLVAKAAPDGYTLVFGNTGPNAVIGLMRKVPYEHKDLKPISTVAFTPMMLVVPSDSPAKTLKEFIAYAKQRGAELNYGSVGNGSLSHLTGEHFNDMAGLKMQHIPYNGGAPLATAFIGGQLHAAFVTGLDGATIEASGKARYLGVATSRRTNVVPGMPAIAEDVPGFTSVAWFGVLAPRGTPDDVVNKLHSAIAAAVARPAIQKMFSEKKIEGRSSTPDEMEKTIQGEIAQWGPVIRRAKIEMN